ncbi:sensor histidine kinase [Spongiimicrobium salis]|uniref:sensor histidine kinase n=1 Tax=Spongiimicrobium salis TaxID=1667022 RepID=UPI00374D6131
MKISVRDKHCLFLLLFHASMVFSQNVHRTDSLLKVLKQDGLPQKNRAELMIDIAYDHTALDSAAYYAQQALEISRAINAPVLEAQAWEEIGAIEQRLGNKGASLEAIFKALQLYDSLKLKENQAASYAQIAGYYIGETDYAQGVDYLKRAAGVYSEMKNNLYETLTLINIGEAYRLSGKLDDAENTFVKVLQLNQSIQDRAIEGYTLGNLGMVYADQGRIKKAKQKLNAGIGIVDDLGDGYSTSIYLAELGTIYQKEKEWDLAEENFLLALAMAKQSELKEQIRDFSRLLVGFYEVRERYSEALRYQKLYQQYQDSIVNKENIQKEEQLKAGYEINKRESEIGLLNKVNTNQKRMVIVLIVGILLVLYIAYLLQKANKRKKKTNEVLSQQKETIAKREQEKTLLLHELNHRTKNNLQMISGLLNLQSRTLQGHPAKEAILSGKYRVEALSLVHRKLYQDGIETKILLEDYIKDLVLGLFQAYGTVCKPYFKIPRISINVDAAVPLALILNEMVINALKYAYTKVEQPELHILVEKEAGGFLQVEVVDNGIGFVAKKTTTNNAFGLKLVTSLIEQLEGTLEKINVTGTHWRMHLKLN